MSFVFIEANDLGSEPIRPPALVAPGKATIEELYGVQPAPALTYTETKAILDRVGYDEILAYISSGTIPAGMAAHYHVPLNMFKRWLNDAPEPSAVLEAIRSCADSLMAKSMAALAIETKDGVQARRNQKFAEHLANLAERLNPETWAPPKKYEPPAPAVNIIIGGGADGLATIPGLDMLRVAS